MACRISMPEPNEKQRLALLEEHRYVAYGGARSGGKSWFVRWKAVLLCLRYPGIKVLITRRTYPELMNNHIDPLRQMLPPEAAKFNKSERRFLFPNGSSIKLGYCNNDGDLGQYQGAEFDVWFADEAGQFPENWLLAIDACVRGANDFPKRTYYTLNPGGPSHGYFKRIFIDRRFEMDEHPEDYVFIQALVQDNIALQRKQPEYIRSLEKLPTKLRMAWLEGRWDVFEGQFFEEFRDDPAHYQDGKFTHVIAPFEIPEHWKIYRSFDWGYNKPFSCGWWAVDEDGVVYRILESYGWTGEANTGVKWPPQQVFQDIARIEREHRWLKGKRIIGIADPAIWNAESGESVADTAAKNQVYFSPGDHARIPGWMQMHYRMSFDENGKPMMYVFSNCKAFIRTIPTLQYSKTRVEDLDTEGEDHVADEVRYFCMSRPIKPTLAQEPDRYKDSPMYQALDIDKADLMPRRATRPRMEVIRD